MIIRAISDSYIYQLVDSIVSSCTASAKLNYDLASIKNTYKRSVKRMELLKLESVVNNTMIEALINLLIAKEVITIEEMKEAIGIQSEK